MNLAAKVISSLLLLAVLEARIHRQYHESSDEEMPDAPAMPLSESEAKLYPDLPYEDLKQIHRDFYFWAYTCLHKDSTGCFKRSPVVERGFTCEVEPISTDDLLEMALKNQMGGPLFHRFFIEILNSCQCNSAISSCSVMGIPYKVARQNPHH